MNYVVKNGRQAEMLAEKQQAVDLWREIETLAGTIRMADPRDEEYLRVSAAYGRIKHELIQQIFSICLYGREAALSGQLDREAMRRAIERYDALWAEWRQLKESSSQCATLYEPNAFSLTDLSGVSGDPARGIGATVDKYRSMLE